MIQLYANEDDAAPSRATLAAIEPEVARGWLKDIVASLVEGSHAYLLPVDAVLRLERGFASIGAAEIESSIAFVREKWSGGRSRWGPVRRPLEQPPLRGVPLEDAVERRFGLFFRTIGGNR